MFNRGKSTILSVAGIINPFVLAVVVVSLSFLPVKDFSSCFVLSLSFFLMEVIWDERLLWANCVPLNAASLEAINDPHSLNSALIQGLR